MVLAISLLEGHLFPSSARAGSEGALVVDPNADHSAHRVDVEVFGWNPELTEVAAVGYDVTRYPRGKHRGEVFLLVFDVGSTVPKQNVHLLYVTQADMPHDPLPLEEAKDRLWGLNYQYKRMWKRRPKRKYLRGAMRVETLWEAQEIEPGICRPWIGFRLEYGGQVRYQAHTPTKVEQSCSTLRLTDTRIYWGRRDIAAAMIRFDYSNTNNEKSVRLLLSPAWHLAQPLKIELQTDRPSQDPLVRQMRRKLAHFGTLHIVPSGAVPAGPSIRYREDYAPLARHLARELGASLGEVVPTDGPDLVVVADSGDQSVPLKDHQSRPTLRRSSKRSSSSYLDDFMIGP